MPFEFKEESYEKQLEDLISSKAPSSHSHSSSDITDIEDTIRDIILEVIDGADESLDTLKELAEALNNDPDFAGTIVTALSGKVDKETGKVLSENDFTDTLKDKMDGVAAGATANDTDANLKNRANHTGEQAISTITDLGSALTSLSNRLDTLEAWKSVMPKKQVRFTGTTDANGDVTINLTSGGFTNIPAIAVTYVFNNNNYGTHFNVKALSTTSISLRVMRNKNTSVGALGGDVDPDEPLASTTVRIIATEF